MISHWEKTLTLVGLVAVVANVVWFGGLFSWNIVKAIYNDHIGLVNTNQGLLSENEALREREKLIPAPYTEPASSLRRRIVRLAGDLQSYDDERAIKRNAIGPFGIASGVPNYQAVQQQNRQQFDAETLVEYRNRGLRDRTIGILKELKAKGIDLNHLDDTASTRPLQNFEPPEMRKELTELRGFAYRLDEKGELYPIKPSN